MHGMIYNEIRLLADYRNTNKSFSGTVSGYKVSVVKGYTYTYAVKYVDNVNYTNRVKGNIVH